MVAWGGAAANTFDRSCTRGAAEGIWGSRCGNIHLRYTVQSTGNEGSIYEAGVEGVCVCVYFPCLINWKAVFAIDFEKCVCVFEGDGVQF